MSLETLVLNNTGVTIICGIAALAEGLRGPCTLKELRLRACGLGDTALLELGEDLTSPFFKLLPQRKGLKTVYGLAIMGDGGAPTKTLCKALVDGLRQNTKLQILFATYDGATVDSFFHLVLPGDSEVPSVLRPRVLAKITGRRDMSLLFYFLQNKPKEVKCNTPAIRKRKASNGPSIE